MSRPLTVLVLAAAVGCGGRPPEPVTVGELFQSGLRFGTTRAEIREALGAPREVDVRTAPNRHVRDATDSLITLRYDGLSFGLNRPGPVERDLLTEVDLTDAGVPLPGALRLGGTSVLEAATLLGPPDATRTAGDTTVNEYAVPGEGAEDRVELHFVGDTLRRVRWSPYVD